MLMVVREEGEKRTRTIQVTRGTRNRPSTSHSTGMTAKEEGELGEKTETEKRKMVMVAVATMMIIVMMLMMMVLRPSISWLVA